MIHGQNIHTPYYIDQLEKQDGQGHFKTLKNCLAISFAAASDAGKLYTRALCATVIILPKQAASLVGMQRFFPDCDPVQVQTWRVVQALRSIVASVVVTITIPFAVFSPQLVVKQCDLLQLRQPKGQKKQKQWYDKAWTNAGNWCKANPSAVKLSGLTGGLASATALIGYAAMGKAAVVNVPTPTGSGGLLEALGWGLATLLIGSAVTAYNSRPRHNPIHNVPIIDQEPAPQQPAPPPVAVDPELPQFAPPPLRRANSAPALIPLQVVPEPPPQPQQPVPAEEWVFGGRLERLFADQEDVWDVAENIGNLFGEPDLEVVEEDFRVDFRPVLEQIRARRQQVGDDAIALNPADDSSQPVASMGIEPVHADEQANDSGIIHSDFDLSMPNDSWGSNFGMPSSVDDSRIEPVDGHASFDFGSYSGSFSHVLASIRDKYVGTRTEDLIQRLENLTAPQNPTRNDRSSAQVKYDLARMIEEFEVALVVLDRENNGDLYLISKGIGDRYPQLLDAIPAFYLSYRRSYRPAALRNVSSHKKNLSPDQIEQLYGFNEIGLEKSFQRHPRSFSQYHDDEAAFYQDGTDEAALRATYNTFIDTFGQFVLVRKHGNYLIQPADLRLDSLIKDIAFDGYTCFLSERKYSSLLAFGESMESLNEVPDDVEYGIEEGSEAFTMPAFDPTQSLFIPSNVQQAEHQLSDENAQAIAQNIGRNESWLTLVNYSGNKLVGTMSQEGVKKSEWSFIAHDGAELALNTRALPEDVMEYYDVTVNDQNILVDENPASTREQCAKMIDATLSRGKFKFVREYYINAILNGLWRTGGLAKVNELSKERLGSKLDSVQVGRVDVDVVANKKEIKITHSLRRQLQTVGEDGERFNQPYFSTWTIVTTIDEKGTENVEMSLSPWEGIVAALPEIEERPVAVEPQPASPVALPEAKQEAAIGYLDYNDNEVKQEKYLKAMETARKALEQNGDVAELLERTQVPKGGDVRSYYRWFLDGVRGFLTSQKYNPQKNYNPIHDVVKARFQGNRMYEYCENLVTKAMRYRSPSDAANLPFEQQFHAIDNLSPEFAANRLAVNFGKLKGTINVNFDPHRETNTPYANYSFDYAGKERTNLRFGTPTWEGYWYSASVVPEFKAFLDALKLEGKKHLYINLQNRNPKYIGDESGRCNALEKLAVEYPETFFIATFAQDSRFYKQSEQYKDMDVAHQFLAAFEDQMFVDPKSGFHFSKNLMHGENRKILTDALHDVHREVFGGRDKLSLAERQAFIEIAYSLMTLRLLEISGADTYNLSCKDAIDRGGKCSSLLFYIAGLLNDMTNDLDFKQEHMTVTHAPALIVKKQAIIHSRRERLLQALNILMHVNAEGLKDLYNVGQPEVCRRDPSLGVILNKIVSKAAKESGNLEAVFPRKVVNGIEVNDDPLSFYEYERANKELYIPAGFDAEIYCPFLHQDDRDIQVSLKNFVNIPAPQEDPATEDKQRLAVIFYHLLGEIKKTPQGLQALQADSNVVYKAIHAAISGCTQSFEASTMKRLDQQGGLRDRDLTLQTPKTPVNIHMAVVDGEIQVTSEAIYTVASMDDMSPQAHISALRQFTVPINAPGNARRLPDQFQVVV
ncbi:MAG: hypothetical protein Q8K75_10565 [Chlamydiales bacterium]|nr:hypothetical protein [Chlamydiales bacterium]